MKRLQPGVGFLRGRRLLELTRRAREEIVARVSVGTSAQSGAEDHAVERRVRRLRLGSRLEMLRGQGAAGDVCLRFFDARGKPIQSDLDERVIGVTFAQLRKVERTIGIAGGRRKYDAILGALRGRWVNVLVTDRVTAEKLVREGGTESES